MQIRKYLFLIIVTLLPINVISQTYYYKMKSYEQNGKEHTNVSGGQFITFRAAICLETNIKGIPVGHGYLRKRPSEPNLYTGSSYWGDNTKFKFSSDKSLLKIYAPNGIIYQYVRTNPPSGTTTCSLIRGKNAPQNTQAPVIGIPIQKPQKCGICYGSGKCSNCNGTGVSTSGHAHWCGACGGSGKCGTCGGSGYSGTVTEYVY